MTSYPLVFVCGLKICAQVISLWIACHGQVDIIDIRLFIQAQIQLHIACDGNIGWTYQYWGQLILYPYSHPSGVIIVFEPIDDLIIANYPVHIAIIPYSKLYIMQTKLSSSWDIFATELHEFTTIGILGIIIWMEPNCSRYLTWEAVIIIICAVVIVCTVCTYIATRATI